MIGGNLFIYQARVWPGTNRVCDSPASAESINCEAFVVMGELRWGFSFAISPIKIKDPQITVSPETELSETKLGPG